MAQRQLKPRECLYCKKDITHMMAQARVCWDKTCRNAFSREKYKKNLKDKICIICTEPFKGTRNSTVCGATCLGLSRKNQFEEEEQIIRCYRCNAFIEVRKIKINGRNLKVGKDKLCADCVKKSRENRSIGKRGAKNPNWKGGIEPKPKMPKEALYKLISQRMKENNPMKRQDVKDRASETLRDRIQSGEIKYKKGPEHHLWKGNREPSFALRTRILSWRRRILKRDNFRCSICGTRENLEVHHIRPFREILNICLKKLEIPKLSKIDINSELFERLGDAVLLEHKLEDGRTLCVPCHENEDKFRHSGKNKIRA